MGSFNNFRLWWAVCLIVLSIANPSKLFASHATGADLSYTCIGNNQYRVEVDLYRDCIGISMPTSIVLSITSSSCGQYRSQTLNKVAAAHQPTDLYGGEIVSPVCPAQINSTTCSPGGHLPGIAKYVYIGVITLNRQCSDWVVSYSLNARNSAVTNLSNPGIYDLYVEAHINNTNNICDNSPYFTSNPVPYFCSGSLTNFNHGVVDIDGDSLSYTLINPLYASGSNVPYRSGYNVSNPLTSSSGFQFSAVTGQMTFTPTGVQNAAVAMLVREYRLVNGVMTMIGSVMRDMQVVVINCSNNSAPSISGINNSSPTNPANYQTTLCSGTQLCFDVDLVDPDGDSLFATWNNGIPGATFSFTGNPSRHVVAHFCWSPTAADIGTHTFSITLRDNACPLYATTSKGFTVVVSPASYNISFTKQDVKCAGGNNGAATVTVTGASAPVYNWGIGSTAQSVSGLSGGWYRVTVNDAGGCAMVDSVHITEPPAIMDSLGMVPTQCNGTVNGKAFVYSKGGGNSPNHITQLWTGPVTPTAQDTLSPVGSDTYYITFTDDSGCVKNDSVFVTQPGPIVIVATASATVTYHGSDISCYGKNDGQVAVFVTGGTQPYNYHWSTNAGTQNNDTIFNLIAGFYKVTITDANGCNDVASKAIVDPPKLSARDSVVNAFHGFDISCFGMHDGRDSVLATGGTGALQYSIVGANPYQSTNVLTGLGAGNITVVVMDLNGCTDTLHNVLHGPSQLAATAGPGTNFINNTNIHCHGGNDGIALANATGGTPGYTYTWSDQYHQITYYAATLTAGNYDVTVLDANGCSATSSTSLVEPPQLTITDVKTNVTCYGDSNGTATVTPAGGVAPYHYTWQYQIPSITATANGLKANTMYIATVKDTNECTISDTITLTEPQQLVVIDSILSNYNSRQISCFGGSDGVMAAFASGGTGPYTYAWPPLVGAYSTTDTVTGLSAGAHPVQVTDANGCKVSATNTLVDPPQLVIADSVIKAYNGYDISCAGLSDGRDSITLAGGTGSYQYSIQGGTYQLGNVINGLSVGSHTIEVKDGNGCIQSKGITVTAPTAVTTTTSVATPYGGQNISCFGLSDGMANANPSGGVGGYTYFWSDINVQVTQQATGLAAGNYSVLVRDANGCSATGGVSLTQPTQIAATITSFTDALCSGAPSGTANVVASGGTGTYSYNWNSNPILTVANPTTLKAGSYTVTVQDANNCAITAQVMINEPSAVVAFDSVTSNYHGQQISCNSAADGEAIARGSGGTPPYTYAWTPGMGSGIGGAYIANVKAGSYGLTVTDAHGCIGTAPISLTEPDAIHWQQPVKMDYNGYDIKCNGDRNGSVSLTVKSGGTSGYTYLWLSDGTSGQVNNALPAGSHKVMVTDINNCTADTTIVLREPAAITFPAIFDTVQCNGLSNATATAIATGGVGNYNYAWGTNPVKNGTTATGMAVGTYTVTVTDKNSCVTTTSAKIDEPTPMGVQIAKQDPTCNQGPDGFVKATASGGRPTYQYAWGGTSSGNADEIRGVTAGVYDLTATDNHGCTITTSVVVTEPAPDTVSAMPAKDTIVYGAATELITAYTTVASGAVAYNWEPVTGLSCNDCAKPTANPQETTEYTLRLTDANGCVAIAKTTVNVTDVRPLYVPNAFSPNDDNLNDQFYVYGSGITEMELKVFNRWGIEVFESHDLATGWNGTFKGQKLDADVYAYYVKVKYLDNSEKTTKGSISLIR